MKLWRNSSSLSRSAAVDFASTEAGCPLASLLHVPYCAERRGMRGLRREPRSADGGARAVSEPSRGHLRRRSGRGVSLNAPKSAGASCRRKLEPGPGQRAEPRLQNRRHGPLKGSGMQRLGAT